MKKQTDRERQTHSPIRKTLPRRWKRRGEHEYREPESDPETESRRDGNPQL